MVKNGKDREWERKIMKQRRRTRDRGGKDTLEQTEIKKKRESEKVSE